VTETFKVRHPYAATGRVGGRYIDPPHRTTIQIVDRAMFKDGSSTLARVEWTPKCDKALDACGGRCCLPRWHVVPCECGGDEPGEPGTCQD